ncbi:kelch-like protein 20 [Oscarella lobularis]|uniref:kelch-like protein 20 n=1 Tax=Oscarella lobularis TaxID=121494 RepID=UPI00331389EE
MNETISLETSGYFSTALFDSFRKSDYLCDVVIVTEDGHRFPAHRIILASASEFFSSMLCGTFIESKQTDVAIRNVEGTVMKMLIEYAYRGEAKCPAALENVLSLYKAAHYVQFDRLFRMCSSWLRKHVDTSNCLSMAMVADRYDDSDLLRAADLIAGRNILLLTEEKEFVSISAEHLGRILTQDEMGVRTEDEVLIILQKWIKHDEESRRDHVQTLSKFVRFPLIDFQESSDFLSDLDLVSHYHTSDGSCQRRIGRDVVLLAAGGEGIMSSTAMIYDPNNDEWSVFPDLKVAMKENRIATSNGKVYALGGSDYCTKTDVVQRYDPGRRQWEDNVQRMHRKRNGMEIVSCSDRIYGLSIGERSSLCEVLDPEMETWTPVSSPVNRLNGRYIVSSLTNTIVAIGSNPEDESGYMKYYPLEDRWCEFKPCSVPFWLSVCEPPLCATTGDQLYIKLPDKRNLIVFDSKTERFSVVKDFFPMRSKCNGLAYDLHSKRVFIFNNEVVDIYDERANKWDIRRKYVYRVGDLAACAFVERNLMLDFRGL